MNGVYLKLFPIDKVVWWSLRKDELNEITSMADTYLFSKILRKLFILSFSCE